MPSDNFNRADSDALGLSWLEQGNCASTHIRILTNRLRMELASVGGEARIAYWSDAIRTSQFSEALLADAPTGNPWSTANSPGVMLLPGSGTQVRGYQLRKDAIDAGAPFRSTYRIIKVTLAGVVTTIASATIAAIDARTWAVGKGVRLEAQVSGASVVLSHYVVVGGTPVLLVQGTDASSPFLDGYIGFFHMADPLGFSHAPVSYDDWTGGGLFPAKNAKLLRLRH